MFSVTYIFTTSALLAGFASAQNSLVAPKGAEVLTVAVFGDYGWTGWNPAPDHFCLEALPLLQAANISVPNELINDCDMGDKAELNNATALQTDTAQYIGQVCAMKNCSAVISVGDNFYDSGIDFSTGGIIRFEEAWVNMYSQGVFENLPWYQCLGNHDVVLGQSGVDFETKVLPFYDSRWNFGTTGLPYHTYDLTGSNWTATFVVVDSDCFLKSYQENTSVYFNEYTKGCHNTTSVQVDFLNATFAASTADWKFLQLHHPYMSSHVNQTDLAPLVSIVEAHHGIVLNGHDHCLGHYFNNNTNFILSGAAGYPEAGDCNNGVYIGPYTKFLAANNYTAANGFVTLDISSSTVNVEYYVRDMLFINGDLYPVSHDLTPSYSFQITEKST